MLINCLTLKKRGVGKPAKILKQSWYWKLFPALPWETAREENNSHQGGVSSFWSQGKGEGHSCSGSHSQLGWTILSWLPWQWCPGVGIFAHICRAFLPMYGGSPQLQRRYRIESSGAFFTMSSLSQPWEVKWAGKIKWQEEKSFMTLISWIYICC